MADTAIKRVRIIGTAILALAALGLMASLWPVGAGFGVRTVYAHQTHPGLSPGRMLGTFDLTYYYVAEAGQGGRWPLYAPGCRKVIAYASKAFHDELSREGTGRLRDGRIVNFEERCDCARPGFRGGRICYTVLNKKRFPWGRGANLNDKYFFLRPFRSLAVDPRVVPLGSALYIPQLRGKRRPDGVVMDGCFRAEDTGALIVSHRIDLFSGTYLWSEWFRKTYGVARVKMYLGGKRCAGK